MKRAVTVKPHAYLLQKEMIAPVAVRPSLLSLLIRHCITHKEIGTIHAIHHFRISTVSIQWFILWS